MRPVPVTLQTQLVYHVYVTFTFVCMFNYMCVYTEYPLSLWESTEVRAKHLILERHLALSWQIELNKVSLDAFAHSPKTLIMLLFHRAF
jgi:hypothetical protein